MLDIDLIRETSKLLKTNTKFQRFSIKIEDKTVKFIIDTWFGKYKFITDDNETFKGGDDKSFTISDYLIDYVAYFLENPTIKRLEEVSEIIEGKLDYLEDVLDAVAKGILFNEHIDTEKIYFPPEK